MRTKTVTQDRQTSSGVDFAPGLETAFPREFQECDCTIESVEGKVPYFVRGTYYLNGPARFGIAGFSYQHWLDGDGMVSALRFCDNEVRFTCRYVRSNKFQAEQSAGRPLYRAFGSAFENSSLNRLKTGVESPVNISVYPLNGHLLAFGEQGLPWELDAESLETRGQFTFNGRLNEASPFAAHPKFDAHAGEMFNFGTMFSPQSPRLYLYRFGREGLLYRKAASLEYPCSVHDFSLSQHYATFYLSPYILDLTGLLQKGRSVMESLQWEPARGSRLLILERNSGEVAASVPLGRRYCLHMINSFEQNGQLQVDVLEFDEPLYGHYQPIPDLFQNVSPGGPVRYVVDLEKKSLVGRTCLPYFLAPDFPSIDPQLAMQCYEEFWMLGISATGNPGRKFFDQLVHARWSEGAPTDVYKSPPMRYLAGEPVFVSAPGSAGGAVICPEYDARNGKSSFLIFDAHCVNQGPVARIFLKHPLYLGFHAVFECAGNRM